jgi:hypothetical protein
MGLSIADVTGADGIPDGRADMFITHWVAQENALYQAVLYPGGALEYLDKTRALRLGEISTDAVGWGCVLADFDLDGLVDLAVANGSTLETSADRLLLRPERMFLFNNRGSRFLDVAPVAGKTIAGERVARGLAAADFDGDGDVDLAVSVNRGNPILLRNDTATDHRSLIVQLTAAPASLFGARIEVEVGDQTHTRWYGADVSFLSMHAPEVVFGLGDASAANSVRVVWADGSETELSDVPAGRVTMEHG